MIVDGKVSLVTGNTSVVDEGKDHSPPPKEKSTGDGREFIYKSVALIDFAQVHSYNAKENYSKQ